MAVEAFGTIPADRLRVILAPILPAPNLILIQTVVSRAHVVRMGGGVALKVSSMLTAFVKKAKNIKINVLTHQDMIRLHVVVARVAGVIFRSAARELYGVLSHALAFLGLRQS